MGPVGQEPCQTHGLAVVGETEDGNVLDEAGDGGTARDDEQIDGTGGQPPEETREFVAVGADQRF